MRQIELALSINKASPNFNPLDRLDAPVRQSFLSTQGEHIFWFVTYCPQYNVPALACVDHPDGTACIIGDSHLLDFAQRNRT